MGGEGFSNRKSCAKCFGKVSNDHAPMGKRDICGGILRSTIKPQMHVSAVPPVTEAPVAA